MQESISPVLIYTEFYNSKLPSRDVSRLQKWNKFYVLKMLISLKLASQDITGGYTHELIKKLVAFLQINSPSKFGHIEESIITDKTVILQIIADLLAIKSNSGPFSEPIGNEFYKDIIDTILIYNEHQFSSVGIGLDKHRIDHLDIWKITLMQGLNAEHPKAYARIGGIKQIIYVQFLKQQFGVQFPEFEKGVTEFTGLASISKIVLLFVELVVAYEKAVKNPVPFVIIGPNDNRFQLLHKLELVVDASAGNADVRVADLFTKPFLKLEDGNLYLLGTSDFDLITTKSWDYYLLKNKLFKKVLPGISSIIDLRGHWGKLYTESFLGLGILRSLEKAGIRILPSDDKNLPDATLIVNEKDVFMIEIKSSALDYKITSAQDIEGFRQFINQKLTNEGKGVPQLNRSIEHLSKHAQTRYGLINPVKKLRVYPIIIYTEPHLSKHAVNDYVNAAAPSLNKGLQEQFQLVEKVTLIPMDFFLENIDLLHQDRALLRNLITEYHRYVNGKKRLYDKKGIYQDFFDAMMSFEAWCIGKRGLYQENTTKIFKALLKIFDIK